MNKNKTNINWDSLWEKRKDLDWWRTPAKDFVKILESLDFSGQEKFYDLGAGIGRHTVLLAKAGFDVYASDDSQAAIDQIEEWLAKEKVSAKTYLCDMAEGPFEKDFFDFVVSYNVIYHGQQERMQQAIDHVYDILKPNGYFYFTCPSIKDGRCGSGTEVGYQAWRCENALDKGEVHCFTTREDLDKYLEKFEIVSVNLNEGSFVHEGKDRFYSDWQGLVKKK
ncbi:class I SAM-dependent methyltransferase [Candidatus Parcubacteria bacterium]|nr:class I SAM-dependent methyltransferase [Candidatus Parcubacteria bacterium]